MIPDGAGSTVTTQWSSPVPLFAVIVAVPSPLAVTVPSADTVATFLSDVLYVTSPSSYAPKLAVSFSVIPVPSCIVFLFRCSSVGFDITVTFTVCDSPLYGLKVNVVSPFFRPFTFPARSTVATLVSAMLNVPKPR